LQPEIGCKPAEDRDPVKKLLQQPAAIVSGSETRRSPLHPWMPRDERLPKSWLKGDPSYREDPESDGIILAKQHDINRELSGVNFPSSYYLQFITSLIK
jgi:hypothetical protein